MKTVKARVIAGVAVLAGCLMIVESASADTLQEWTVFGEHSDQYEKKKRGVQPYETYFSDAEMYCLGEGLSYPGILTPEKEAQLQTSEMVLCIEMQINELMLEDQLEEQGRQHRLYEIEESLQKLMKERENLLSGR